MNSTVYSVVLLKRLSGNRINLELHKCMVLKVEQCRAKRVVINNFITILTK